MRWTMNRAWRQTMTPKEVVKLRERLGYTQRQLAERIGATQVTVSRWETGAHPPRGANLKALRDLTAKRKGKR
jgi:DNA-binding transcriptional regulator YiaG